jgi:hypothetical protein
MMIAATLFRGGKVAGHRNTLFLPPTEPTQPAGDKPGRAIDCRAGGRIERLAGSFGHDVAERRDAGENAALLVDASAARILVVDGDRNLPDSVAKLRQGELDAANDTLAVGRGQADASAANADFHGENLHAKRMSEARIAPRRSFHMANLRQTPSID